MLGVSEMQNLISKVELLQQLAAGAKSHLDEERVQSAAKLEFDQVSNSFGASRTHGADAADADYNRLVSTDHGIEAVDEAAKTEKPSSELLSEKDLSVYKMEISEEFKESQEEWNRRVMKRLAFDVEKLSDLQSIARELMLKMEKYGASVRQNRLQFDTLKLNLREAEEAIFDLIDRNGKLTAAVEAYSDSGEEMGRGERSRVLEEARSASDRIGMVELELQKIDYIFLKLQEEWESSPTKGDRTPRVLLRDYLYGRKGKMGKKRGYFCGCVRPKTQDKY